MIKDQILTDKVIKFIDNHITYKRNIKRFISKFVYPEIYIRSEIFNISLIKLNGDILEKIDFKRIIEYYKD